MNSSVPCHWLFKLASVCAVPTQLAMCRSWPQLCATNVSLPRNVVLTLLA